MRRLSVPLVVLSLLGASFSEAANRYPPGPGGTCPAPPTIYNIQNVAASCHPATLDTVVGVGGIVTGFDAKPAGFAVYFQNSGGGAYSGVNAFTGSTNYKSSPYNLALGDSILVSGTTQEFPDPNGETEIEGPDVIQNTNDIVITKVSSGNALPAFHVTSTLNEINWIASAPGNQGELWEGCLVRVRGPLTVRRRNLSGTAAGLPANMFLCTTPFSSDSICIDGTTLATFTPPALGSTLDSVQGIPNQRTSGSPGVNSYRLQLRDGNDIFLVAPPNLVDAYPVEDNQLRLVFDRNVDVPTAQNTSHYSLGSGLNGSTVDLATVEGGVGPYVRLSITSVQVDGDLESITAQDIGAASCPLCLMSNQTRSLINGVLDIATIQSPDPDFLPLFDDRSRFAGPGTSPGTRLSFRGSATQQYGSLQYLQGEAGGPRSGIPVFAPIAPLVPGRKFLVAGQVQEFGGETEVVNTVYIVDEGAAAPPVPIVGFIPELADTTTDQTQSQTTGEDFEGVLVRIEDAKVCAFSTPPRDPVAGGSFLIATPFDAPMDTILVSSLGNHYTFDADTFFVVTATGVLHFSSGTFRVLPRGDQDVQKKPLTAPPYEPEKWNDGGGDPPNPDNKQGDNNCYRYGVNAHSATDGFARPGRKGGSNPPGPGTKAAPVADYNCEKFKAAAVADGLTESTKDAVCDNGYKVALVVGLVQVGNRIVQDYHWYRQDDNGKWSHKPGGQPATNKDSKNNEITNPETADKGKTRDGDNQYANFCGYFCVTKATAVSIPLRAAHADGLPESARRGLTEILDSTPSRTPMSTKALPGSSLLTGVITVNEIARSGEEDSSMVFTSTTDLDSVTAKLTGLSLTADPSWESHLGYAGFALDIDGVPSLGSKLVTVWRGVVRVDEGSTRTHYADSKGLEAWLMFRIFGSILVSVPETGASGTAAFLRGEPNPFALSARIRFMLGAEETVTLRVLDIAGRTVATPISGRLMPAGPHEATLDGRALAPGVYTLRLQLGGRIITSTLVHLR